MLEAEKAVLSELEKLRLDPSLITDEQGTIDTEYVNAIETNISALDAQTERLADLYLDGGFSLDKLNMKRKELSEQRERLERELAGTVPKKADITIGDAKWALTDLSCIHDLDYETQKIIVNKLISKVVLTVDTAEIHWRFKL